jgi:hypothetical protein
MLNFTRALLKLRREHPALANAADFQPLYAETNKYPFVYLRVARTERIMVAIFSRTGLYSYLERGD